MWGKRESLTANDNDLISVSLKIIRAPSFGRGRRAKRVDVGGGGRANIASPALCILSFRQKESVPIINNHQRKRHARAWRFLHA